MSQGTVHIASGRFLYSSRDKIKKLLCPRLLRRIIVFSFFPQRMRDNFINNKAVPAQKTDTGSAHIGPAEIQGQIRTLLAAIWQIHIGRQR